MLINRDIICTEDLTKEEILSIIQLATKMKKDPNNEKWVNCMSHKNFIMLFFSPSVRTHLSFSTAATALGGHAQYIWDVLRVGLLMEKRSRTLRKLCQNFLVA